MTALRTPGLLSDLTSIAKFQPLRTLGAVNNKLAHDNCPVNAVDKTDAGSSSYALAGASARFDLFASVQIMDRQF